jgi:hypothetical protein
MRDQPEISVRSTLRCLECRREWDEPAERWRMYLLHDEPHVTAVYCPACASREVDE